MASPANSEQRIPSLKFEDDLERWIKDALCPELGSWQFLHLAPLHTMSTGLVACATLWQEKEHPEHLLRLDLEVCQSQRLARERLSERPNEMVHPFFAENGGPLPALGDARLVTCLDATDIPISAYFTRNNVMVAVMRADQGVMDIAEIASLVDRLLQRDFIPETRPEEDKTS